MRRDYCFSSLSLISLSSWLMKNARINDQRRWCLWQCVSLKKPVWGRQGPIYKRAWLPFDTLTHPHTHSLYVFWWCHTLKSIGLQVDLCVYVNVCVTQDMQIYIKNIQFFSFHEPVVRCIHNHQLLMNHSPLSLSRFPGCWWIFLFYYFAYVAHLSLCVWVASFHICLNFL